MEGGKVGLETDFGRGDGCVMQGAHDCFLSFSLEIYKVLYTTVSPINSKKDSQSIGEKKSLGALLKLLARYGPKIVIQRILIP